FEEIAHDFWRRKIYGATPLIARLALSRGLSPDEWLALSKRIRNHPELVILPQPGNHACDVIETQMAAAFENARGEWKISTANIATILRESDGLSRDKSKCFHLEGIEKIVENLNALF